MDFGGVYAYLSEQQALAAEAQALWASERERNLSMG